MKHMHRHSKSEVQGTATNNPLQSNFDKTGSMDSDERYEARREGRATSASSYEHLSFFQALVSLTLTGKKGRTTEKPTEHTRLRWMNRHENNPKA